jgi:chemotaxis protein methyltransferase WspC
MPSRLPAVSGRIDLERARQLGDLGKFKEAAELCEAYIKQQGCTSQVCHLLGLVRDAMGDMQSAAECYRKVLYLEPNHADALMHLALLSEKQGDLTGARRLRERARRAEEHVQK